MCFNMYYIFPKEIDFYTTCFEIAKKVNASGPGYEVGFKPLELESQRIFIMDLWKVPPSPWEPSCLLDKLSAKCSFWGAKDTALERNLPTEMESYFL